MQVNQLIAFVIFFALRAGAQSVGGATSGAASYCDSVNSGFISLNGYVGQILYWESSENNGQSWLQISNPTSTQSYNKLKKTTMFRAIVKDGSFPQDTSTVSTITIHIPGIAGNLQGGGTYCLGTGPGTLQLLNAPGTVNYWQRSTSGGSPWTDVQNTSFSLPYSNITVFTSFRAVVQTVPGCPADTSAIVSFSIQSASVSGLILQSDSVCPGSPGDTLQLSGYSGNITGWLASFNGNTWDATGSNHSTFSYSTVSQTVHYRAIVKNGVCPADTSSAATIAVYPVVPAEAGPDVTITLHESILLAGSGSGSPRWNNSATLSDSSLLNPVAKPMRSTTYVLTLTDTHGCLSSDSVRITVFIPVPSAITPNGDGANDYFVVPQVEDFHNNSLMIFDRWGIQVYKAAPYTNDWNGRSQAGEILDEGIYYYILDYGNGEKPVSSYILIERGA